MDAVVEPSGECTIAEVKSDGQCCGESGRTSSSPCPSLGPSPSASPTSAHLRDRLQLPRLDEWGDGTRRRCSDQGVLGQSRSPSRWSQSNALELILAPPWPAVPSQAVVTSKSITQATSYRANFPVPQHRLPPPPPPTSRPTASQPTPTYDRTLHTIVHSQSPYLYALVEDPLPQEGKERQLCFGVTPASSLNSLLVVTKSGFVLPPKASGSAGQVSRRTSLSSPIPSLVTVCPAMLSIRVLIVSLDLARSCR